MTTRKVKRNTPKSVIFEFFLPLKEFDLFKTEMKADIYKMLICSQRSYSKKIPLQ